MHARPCIRTQKRPHFAPRGKMQASLTIDFFRLTLAAPAYTICTAIRIERKSQAFLICNLVFGNFGNPRIVCGAANLQRGVESIHNLQNAVHYQIPRRFSLIKRAWIRITTASSSSLYISRKGLKIPISHPFFTFLIMAFYITIAIYQRFLEVTFGLEVTI